MAGVLFDLPFRALQARPLAATMAICEKGPIHPKTI